jgi:geranylgeranyl diphosphate synthase type I
LSDVDSLSSSSELTVGDEIPRSLDKIASLVDQRIQDLFEYETLRWSSLDESFTRPLTDLMNFALAGGKRLRPAFCYWAYVATGGEDPEMNVLDAAAALELLHCFALIHDDVMDDSPFRRGSASIHSQYSTYHQGLELSGDPQRFGDAVAILIGDLAFVYADRLLEAAPLKARQIFSELRLEVNFGQYLDVVGTARRSYDAEFAAKVAIYKSGKYTVERPLHLGAALAGAKDSDYSHLSLFGIPLGEAFQLRDDVLGIFGESDKTGKPVGDDLREGKPTLLYALAHDRANERERELLDELFGRENLDAKEVETLQEVFVATGSLALVENRIEELTELAITELRLGGFDPIATKELESLAEYIGRRRS